MTLTALNSRHNWFMRLASHGSATDRAIAEARALLAYRAAMRRFFGA